MQKFSFATAHYWGFGHVTKRGRAGMVAPEPDQNRSEKPPHWQSGAQQICGSRDDLTEERCQGLGWLQLCTIIWCFTPDCFFI